MHFVRDALLDDEVGARVTTTAILGVGSPFGDDRAGWLVVEALAAGLDAREREATRVRLVALDRPGAMLLEALRGVDRAVVVDAVVGVAPPGTVTEVDTAELSDGSPISSHGFGMARALALGAALHRLPAELRVLGIAIESAASAEPSDAVRAAAERVAAELRRWLLEGAPA